MARLVAVPVSIQLWQDMATKGWACGDKFIVRCAEGLPEGAELVNSYYDGERRAVVFIFHHESFRDVSLDDEIPEMRIIYRKEKLQAHFIFLKKETACDCSLLRPGPWRKAR